MSYQSFRKREIEWTPATLATFATVEVENGQTVATVANVAVGLPKFVDTLGARTVADVANVAGGRGENESNVDAVDEAEERAAILEYDAGLPRAEAERLAFGRPPTPGVTIRAPAIELSAAEYDRHLDAMIRTAGEGTAEATKLSYAKLKGWVVPRGDETVFTRGR